MSSFRRRLRAVDCHFYDGGKFILEEDIENYGIPVRIVVSNADIPDSSDMKDKCLSISLTIDGNFIGVFNPHTKSKRIFDVDRRKWKRNARTIIKTMDESGNGVNEMQWEFDLEIQCRTPTLLEESLQVCSIL